MKYLVIPTTLCMFFVSYTPVVASQTGDEPLKEKKGPLSILQRPKAVSTEAIPSKTREDHLVQACSQLRSEVEIKSKELQSAQDKIAQLEEELVRTKKGASKLQSERDSYQNQLRVAIQAIGQRDPGELEELKKQVSVLNMHSLHLQQQLTLRQQERDKVLSELSLFKSYAKSDAIGYQEALTNKDAEMKRLSDEIEMLRTNPFVIQGKVPIEVSLTETEVVRLELNLEEMFFTLVNGKTIYDLANEQKAKQQEENSR